MFTSPCVDVGPMSHGIWEALKLDLHPLKSTPCIWCVQPGLLCSRRSVPGPEGGAADVWRECQGESEGPGERARRVQRVQCLTGGGGQVHRCRRANGDWVCSKGRRCEFLCLSRALPCPIPLLSVCHQASGDWLLLLWRENPPSLMETFCLTAFYFTLAGFVSLLSLLFCVFMIDGSVLVRSLVASLLKHFPAH